MVASQVTNRSLTLYMISLSFLNVYSRHPRKVTNGVPLNKPRTRNHHGQSTMTPNVRLSISLGTMGSICLRVRTDIRKRRTSFWFDFFFWSDNNITSWIVNFTILSECESYIKFILFEPAQLTLGHREPRSTCPPDWCGKWILGLSQHKKESKMADHNIHGPEASSHTSPWNYGTCKQILTHQALHKWSLALSASPWWWSLRQPRHNVTYIQGSTLNLWIPSLSVTFTVSTYLVVMFWRSSEMYSYLQWILVSMNSPTNPIWLMYTCTINICLHTINLMIFGPTFVRLVYHFHKVSVSQNGGQPHQSAT